MTPLTITFDQAKRAGACEETYRAMGRHLGGITRYGRHTPVPLETVLDVCGFDDAVWGMDVIGAHKQMRLFAADCAEHVLSIWEKVYADDDRPRQAIAAARAYARGEIDAKAARDAAWAARDAAWAARDAAGATWDAARAAWATWYAARDAARSAARDAARAAARDAARAAARDARAAARATWYAARDARAAAGDAEREWQTERLRAYLRGEVAP